MSRRRIVGTSVIEVIVRIQAMLAGMEAGQRLPTLEELAELWRYDPRTVSKALQELARGSEPEVVLVRGRRQGYYKAGGDVAKVVEREMRELISRRRPGSRVPSPEELAQTHGVELYIARGVLRRLREEGTLFTLRGRLGGSFVAARPGRSSDAPPIESPTAVDDELQGPIAAAAELVERFKEKEKEAGRELLDATRLRMAAEEVERAALQVAVTARSEREEAEEALRRLRQEARGESL